MPTRAQSRTILRKPTFREVEERFFPGKSAASQKNKLVKSQSLDSDCRGSGLSLQEVQQGSRTLSPGMANINNRPQTPKFGGDVSTGTKQAQGTQPTGRQGRWLGRRAREVFLDKGALEEKPEDERQSRPRAATAEVVVGNPPPGTNTKPRQLMKKLFQR